jgi:hypothetical protein
MPPIFAPIKAALSSQILVTNHHLDLAHQVGQRVLHALRSLLLAPAKPLARKNGALK